MYRIKPTHSRRDSVIRLAKKRTAAGTDIRRSAVKLYAFPTGADTTLVENLNFQPGEHADAIEQSKLAPSYHSITNWHTHSHKHNTFFIIFVF